ncbi:MAG: hypothetical protein ONB48_18610, partial [candidate division KSB1 bacterium]|nr:hypothetical protein [candidate division KSB1 bacterium]MDZ7287658.1 hypothetical protein [candidate division KSB1 bacterium]MDZ7355255.1 hypothetical protein [candidate division KSB1 bacterium]MDZ7398078.1 hypothetical protein [candidate division KSB1 bacterium]MDZ7418369.1 hypothetical protein [candidate division KSB1 bacterium]
GKTRRGTHPPSARPHGTPPGEFCAKIRSDSPRGKMWFTEGIRLKEQIVAEKKFPVYFITKHPGLGIPPALQTGGSMPPTFSKRSNPKAKTRKDAKPQGLHKK